MKAVALIVSLTSVALGQTEADSINQIVDSLFIQATTKNINYRDQVKPAQEALGAMGEAAVPRLVEKMDTQDARSMLALIDIFKLIGTPAVPYIVDALGKTDPFKRRLAARALGEMKDSTAVDGLLGYIDDPDFRIRAGTVNALGRIGDRRGIDAAVKALSDDDYLVRLDAAIALSLFADPGTIDILIEALSDPYYGVRFKASEALGKMGESAAIPVKRALLTEKDAAAYYLLIEIAGNLKDGRLVATLTDILKSSDPLVRAFAVEALGKLDSKDAEKALRELRQTETHPFVIAKLDRIDLE